MAVINFPILYIPDPAKGRPLFNGQVFVGEPDLDPEIVANQKQLRVATETGALVNVTQPFLLSAGGVPTYNGSAVRLDVDGNYSIKILDKLGGQAYYIDNVFEGQPITEAGMVGALNLQFSTVSSLVSGQSINMFSSNNPIDWTEYEGQDVSTVVNNTTSKAGGAKYTIKTVGQATADGDVIDGTGAPNYRGGNHALSGGTHVAIIQDEAGILKGESFGIITDYNKGSFTGTDNSEAFALFLDFIGKNAVQGAWEGLFYCSDPIVCDQTVSIRCRNKNTCAVYFPATLSSGTDCLTFLYTGTTGGGIYLEGFSVLGAYSTATSTSNKGLVTRQCARTTFKDVVVSNFDICYHQDGGFLNNYFGISLTNYRTSPLRYTFNEYADGVTTGVAHNIYYGLVVAHELLTGAGTGAHILHGEVTFIHPRAEDQGQEFFTIEHLSSTIQNVYIINPQNRSDAAGTRGRCLHIIGDSGDVIKDVQVISPDFISESGFDVITIDGNGIENINIEGGKIEGGDNGLFITNGARGVNYTPSYSRRHQLHAVLCNSTGAGNYFYPKTVSECNQSATLTGNDQAFIKFDTSGQRGMVGPTTFMDASCQWGVSRPSGANPNVRTAVTADYTGTMAGTNRNVQFAEVGSGGTQTYTATNVTTDRSFDADTVSVAELADVVGTLISDLRNQGKVL